MLTNYTIAPQAKVIIRAGFNGGKRVNPADWGNRGWGLRLVGEIGDGNESNSSFIRGLNNDYHHLDVKHLWRYLQSDGHGEGPLPEVERNKLNRLQGFSRGNMENIEAASSKNGRMLIAQSSCRSKCSGPIHRGSYQTSAYNVLFQISAGGRCVRF